MAVRILRRPKAVADAESLAGWIAKDNLDAALRFLENLEATLEQLSRFPASGAPFEIDVPELANLRFARVSGFRNHVVFYIERASSIEVVRVLHGARDIDAELRKG